MVTFTDFWPRLITTSFWIAVSLFAFHSDVRVIFIYWGGIHLVALYEVQTLLSVSTPSMFINMLTSCLIFLALSLPHFGRIPVDLNVLLPLAFAPFVAALIDSKGNFWKTSVTGISIVWITIPCYLLFKFTLLDVPFLMGFLTVTWIMDAGAYFAGHLVGRTPLLARISPKKTVEGTLGGAVITFLVAHIVAHYVDSVPWSDWMVIAFISATFGQLGDLFESMFKRALEVKDSGTFMGKAIGGLCDRFDSPLFAVVFVNAWIHLHAL